MSEDVKEVPRYASGGLEFHNRLRILDNYHKEMQLKIDAITRKMEAKHDNEIKFRDVMKQQLEREIDELEEEHASAKVDHQQHLKRIENKIRENDKRKYADEARKDLYNHKLQFMKDLYKYDPRWKDKINAKKKMELNRLKNKSAQIQAELDILNKGADTDLNHQIKDAKFDIYKLQKHADIKRTLLYSNKHPDHQLIHQIHRENNDLDEEEEAKEYQKQRDLEAEEIRKKAEEEEEARKLAEAKLKKKEERAKKIKEEAAREREIEEKEEQNRKLKQKQKQEKQRQMEEEKKNLKNKKGSSN